MMDKTIYCKFQLFPPSRETMMGINEAGRGNCFECTPHGDNRNCTHFCPVTFCTLEVIENETDLLDEDHEWNRAGEWD